MACPGMGPAVMPLRLRIALIGSVVMVAPVGFQLVFSSGVSQMRAGVSGIRLGCRSRGDAVPSSRARPRPAGLRLQGAPGRDRPARYRYRRRLGLRIPLFRAPAACWCARATVESTLTSQVISPAASALACSPVSTPRQVPSRCQRRNSPYTVCHGPYCAGTSRHGAPVCTATGSR